MRENAIDTEQYREYVYGDGTVYRIDRPKTLFVKSDDRGDSHRIVDDNDVTHYPKRGWIAIRWYAPTEPVSF
ncbi:hypothetical protein EVB39_026 [Rhizobium phage RHph_TM3_3_9]|nr:hypothetical protein EVB39_026 [Rhizobium phage RHph_TM3_3_9]QIG68547.1 hypothetical protein EVB66_026 [Rhizobium phage RHph_TM3_3_13]QIG74405.1 hypothetical protein EVC09_025 [Rhizobium phage RHph_TM3_3_10]QXV74518.1 hypothetical protein [Rhizobium phage RHEph19]